MTEYELSKQYADVKITWPLLYRTFVLIYMNKTMINHHETVGKIPTNGRGKMIRNPRAYRRAGGVSDVPQRTLKEYDKAWIFFKTRAKDIAAWLYSRKHRSIANPIYTFGKSRESLPLAKAMDKFFKHKAFANLAGGILTLALQTKFDDETITASIWESTNSLEVRQGNRMLFETDLKARSPYFEFKPLAQAVGNAL